MSDPDTSGISRYWRWEPCREYWGAGHRTGGRPWRGSQWCLQAEGCSSINDSSIAANSRFELRGVLGSLLKNGKKTIQYLEFLFLTSWANRCPSGFKAESLVMSFALAVSVATDVPLEFFHLTTDGHILGGQDLLGQFEAPSGGHVRMNGRLRGGVRPPSVHIPGQWTCGVCGMEGCWPARSKCFRCAAPRFGAAPRRVPRHGPQREQAYPANLLPSQFR